MATADYTPVSYKGKPSTDTPVSAANLNKTDKQVEVLTKAVQALENALANKIDAPANPQEDDMLVYKGGKWISQGAMEA